MLSDLEIAQNAEILSVDKIAKKVGINPDDLEFYGKYKAKIDPNCIKANKNGKVILVTAISPTPAGEGKSTTTIGLTDALNKLGKNTMVALREPSFGPVMGVKGGAAGGGYAQVIPMEDINLHFTGDLHAITTANNAIASMIDNHIHQGNKLGIDPTRIIWHRCLDMNDRALRSVIVGLGGSSNGVPREDHFDITVASEVMAVLCLSTSLEDFKKRIARMIVAYTYDKKPVTVDDLNATGAVALIMKDALKPNLVQTLEHNPALIHGGPFANIAHGCNSVIATKLAMKLADYVVTEAGFGADLGAEKFYDIKCRLNDLKPDCTVLVTTVRGLKYHGNDNLEEGLKNLEAHINNLLLYSSNLVVDLNLFDDDKEEEIDLIRKYCEGRGISFEVSSAFKDGSKGAINLANKVIDICDNKNDFKLLYGDDLDIKSKIEIICKKIYHAEKVNYSDKALDEISKLEDKKSFPICIAKTQYSFSDNAKAIDVIDGFEVTVRDIRLYNGAGFITVLLGNIMTMPGLPRVPNYEHIDIEDGNIIGLS